MTRLWVGLLSRRRSTLQKMSCLTPAFKHNSYTSQRGDTIWAWMCLGQVSCRPGLIFLCCFFFCMSCTSSSTWDVTKEETVTADQHATTTEFCFTAVQATAPGCEHSISDASAPPRARHAPRIFMPQRIAQKAGMSEKRFGQPVGRFNRFGRRGRTTILHHTRHEKVRVKL